MIYVETDNTVVEFRDQLGRIGVPTGLRTSGGASAIFGDHELLAPNVALIEHTDRNHRFPFESAPTKVFGETEDVIFHLGLSWDEFDAMIAAHKVQSDCCLPS